MNKIRETIRLHQDAGLSNPQIARALGISRPSVAQSLSDYRSSGLSYSAIAAMSDDELDMAPLIWAPEGLEPS